jgi:hypothetical protein
MSATRWTRPAIAPAVGACVLIGLAGCTPSFTDLEEFQTLERVEYAELDGVTAEGGTRSITVKGTFATGVCSSLSARLRDEGRALTVRVVSTHSGGPCPDEVIRRAYALRIEDLSPGEYRIVVIHAGGIGSPDPAFDGEVLVQP